ncbi:MAG: hypothetical protein MUF61_01890 [archaeon]|jgi:hypothetical protein|nr:hypothetical protein [archaeon]
MNKRGQFFLIAALVIIGIVLGMSTVYVSTRMALKADNSVYDLSEEIDYESNQVIGYGVVKSLPSKTIGDALTNLSKYYSATNPDKDLVIVYGNEDEINGLFYEEESTNLPALSTGGSDVREVNFYRRSVPATGSINSTTGKIQIDFGRGNRYEFDLNPGENFYIVLKKKVQNETIVAVK